MSQVVSKVQVGLHELETNVLGSGLPAVVIEPAFGGSAAGWQSIAESLAQQTTVVTYNRAPYGVSSRARDGRSPGEIARDLHGVLDAVGIDSPVVLVGHSAGGLYVRAFAALYPRQVAGMVLIDSTPEAQERLRGNVPWRIALTEALTVPLLCVLPRRMLGAGAGRVEWPEERGDNWHLLRGEGRGKPAAAGGRRGRSRHQSDAAERGRDV